MYKDYMHFVGNVINDYILQSSLVLCHVHFQIVWTPHNNLCGSAIDTPF